jgi:hypothetical protein
MVRRGACRAELSFGSRRELDADRAPNLFLNHRFRRSSRGDVRVPMDELPGTVLGSEDARHPQSKRGDLRAPPTFASNRSISRMYARSGVTYFTTFPKSMALPSR